MMATRTRCALLLYVYFVSCIVEGEGTCDYGERDVHVGERVYDFESNNGIAKCIVAECTVSQSFTTVSIYAYIYPR